MAEFEPGMISSRTKAALVPANKRGKKPGGNRGVSLPGVGPAIARNGRFIEPDQCDLACPVPFAKRFHFAAWPNQSHILRRPVPQRGGSRSSRTRDGMRWTQVALLTRACAGGRRSRVVLTPRRWRQVCGMAMSALTGPTRRAGEGDKQARSPGRARRKPLKPLRGECRVFPV